MAKKLVHDYTFSPSTNTIVIDYVYKPERFLLITNVTDNVTIYQFNSSTLGFASVSYDYVNETTTLVVNYDCSSMSSTDKLQIFVEQDFAAFEPSETFVDPVSKFRISQPENLIDTDFEYGLQSTKWETLELVKNIPTFFSRTGDLSFSVNNVEILADSDSVLVTLNEDHNLLPGSPVIVVGTKSVSCDGTFVVTSIPTATTFRYRAKAIQTTTGSIYDGISTQISPGSRYQGTEFTLNAIDTIVTDANANSTMTVTTLYPTKFEPGTSFYLTNSVGPVTFFANASLVEPEIFVSSNVLTTNNTPTGETESFSVGAVQPYDYTGRTTDGGKGVYYFNSNGISLSGNNIVFATEHGLTDNKWHLYVVGEGNTGIGGLTNYTKYVVRVVDATTIYLTTALNGTTPVTLSSAGSNAGVMRSAFIRGLRLIAADSRLSSRRYITFEEEVAPYFGVGAPDRNIPVFFFQSGGGLAISTQLFSPSIYYPVSYINTTTMRFGLTPTGSHVGTGRGAFDGLCVPATFLSDSSSIYFENHGLATGDGVTFNLLGNAAAPSGVTGGTFYGIQKVNDNRVQLTDATTGSKIEFTSIGNVDSQFSLTGSTYLETNDSFRIPEHGISDGTLVTYSNPSGNPDVGGLTAGNTYYTVASTTNTLKLATTESGFNGSLISFNQTAITVSVANDTITIAGHGLSSQDLIRYTSDSPINGLRNGGYYYLGNVDVNTVSLHTNPADAANLTNKINLFGTPAGTGAIRNTSIVDITSNSSGTHRLTTEAAAGGSDGVYNLINTTSSTTFTLASNSQVSNRVFNLNTLADIDVKNDAIRITNNYLRTGTTIEYITTSTPIGGLSANTTYYVVKVSPDYIRLADTQVNALLNNYITVTSVGDSSSVQRLQTATVTGDILGVGNVTIASGSTSVTGTGTKFNAIFVKGDDFVVFERPTEAQVYISSIATNTFTANANHNLSTEAAVRMNSEVAPTGTTNDQLYYARVLSATTFTLHPTPADATAGTNTVSASGGTNVALTYISDVGNIYPYQINSVNTTTDMTLDRSYDVTLTDKPYAVGTGLFVRADGFALHRPYDGGVELIPSRNPDSTMIRQTRKYFRYQSGKGIQVSFAVNFSPSTTIDTMTWANVSGNIIATVNTRYPHRLTPNSNIVISGATISSGTNYWNGSHTIDSTPTPTSMKLELAGEPADAAAQGLVEYYVDGWENSLLKCGMFDDQNGLYFEYDGLDLYCCRRSSVVQLSGSVSVTFKSGLVSGTNTKFLSQLSEGDFIVIKGQSYRVADILNDTNLYILPTYRGVTGSNIIVTKTIDTKVPQAAWSIDKCDGTGPSGYVLDLNRIQMAYMDYAWYGAGKVRFGFKDQRGKVIYCHEFIHNNKFTEAYLRSGNIPARYEIENTGTPSYVPALAHWGTSVIMDGRFDDDKAYVFTASSKSLSLVGSGVDTLSIDSQIETTSQYYIFDGSRYREAGYALKVNSPSSAFNTLSPGLEVAMDGLAAGTLTDVPTDSRISQTVYQSGVSSRIGFSSNTSSTAARTLVMVDRQPSSANAGGNATVTLGTISGSTDITYEQPLISIRLAPSVDSSAPGSLGSREIINRMQLILNSVGVLATHAVEVNLRLNGSLSSYPWERVTNPSLSQLIYHDTTSRIEGGTAIYTFRAQGGTGTPRTPVLTQQDLGELATLGNSIMGGDNVYPDGPDVLTVTVRLVEDVSAVTTENPFSIAGRISWSESQA